MSPDEFRAALEDASRSASDGSAALARLAAALAIHCSECGVAWTDPGERWGGFHTDDEPPDVIVFCPGCAELEFGY